MGDRGRYIRAHNFNANKETLEAMKKETYVLIWVDHFERFYLMPDEAWEDFQDTEYYTFLGEIGGYSEHEPGVDVYISIANKTIVANQVGKLGKDLQVLLVSREVSTKESLLGRYLQVKDDLLEYTAEYHDAMYFDIEGFAEDELDEEELQELEDRVKNFEQLLECLKKIDYTYA